ncbi:PD-(D/E)XK nuclease family protein [Candidatus Methanomassiliicoccus intestinalis]
MKYMPDSWSFSKSQIWNTCKKMYYYTYVKRFDADDEGKAANNLYQLTSLHPYKGELVHKEIERYILQALCGNAYDLNKASVNASRQIDWMYKKMQTIERMNGKTVSEEQLNNAKAEISKCLHNFKSDIWPSIFDYPHISIESFDKFRCGDVDVLVKLDYVVKDKRSGIKIFDWKTGLKKGDDFYQSVVYAMHAMSKYGLDNEHVSVDMIYLSELNRDVLVPDRKDIKEMEGRICDETDEMRSLQGIPEENIGDHCTFCKYYTLCNQSKDRIYSEKVTV